MGGEGLPVPPNDGRAYTAVTLDAASEPEQLLPSTTQTGSVVIRAWTVSGDAVYIGWDDDVTPSTGFPLEQGDTLSIQIDNEQQSIWAVGESAGDELRVIAIN